MLGENNSIYKIYEEILLENCKLPTNRFRLIGESAKKDLEPFRKFFEELSEYQSNHYGAYEYQFLRDEYFKLPEDFRKMMSVPKSRHGNCFRGDDGKNEKLVSSFVYHENPETAKRNAHFYGHYVYSLSRDVRSFSATMLIDFNKLVKYFGKKLTYKIFDDYNIGDTENEILVFDIRYK
jgi:hypothetical protein